MVIPSLDADLNTSEDVTQAKELVAKGDREGALDRLKQWQTGIERMSKLHQNSKTQRRTEAKVIACTILKTFLDATEVRTWVVLVCCGRTGAASYLLPSLKPSMIQEEGLWRAIGHGLCASVLQCVETQTGAQHDVMVCRPDCRSTAQLFVDTFS